MNAPDPTFNGFVKTNSATAYNAYVWPDGPLPVKAQLQTDASGNLTWADADAIPWTSKGQLVVGTGIGTDTLLDVGVETSFLMANPATASGLEWSNNSDTAVILPSGPTASRPPIGTPVLAGHLRFNTDIDAFEGYQGPNFLTPGTADWFPLSIQPTGPTYADSIFYYNTQTLSTNYTIPANANAVTAGPISLASGVTVTVTSGSSWVII